MIQHEHALGFRTEIKHKIEHTKTEYLVQARVKAGLNTLSYQTKISRGSPNPGTTTDGRRILLLHGGLQKTLSMVLSLFSNTKIQEQNRIPHFSSKNDQTESHFFPISRAKMTSFENGNKSETPEKSHL